MSRTVRALLVLLVFVFAGECAWAEKRRDPYRVLGVEKDSSDREIKKAYRQKALQYHPDKQPADDEKARETAERKFREVADAFELLSDEESRRDYDQNGFPEDRSSAKQQQAPPHWGGGGRPSGQRGHFHQQQQPGGFHFSQGGPGGFGAGGSDPFDMFAHFFGGGPKFADPGFQQRSNPGSGRTPQPPVDLDRQPSPTAVQLPASARSLGQALSRRSLPRDQGRSTWFIRLRGPSEKKLESASENLEKIGKLFRGVAQFGEIQLPPKHEGGARLAAALKKEFAMPRPGVYVLHHDGRKWTVVRGFERTAVAKSPRKLSAAVRDALPSAVTELPNKKALKDFLELRESEVSCTILLLTGETSVGPPVWLHRMATVARECHVGFASSANKPVVALLEELQGISISEGHSLVVLGGPGRRPGVLGAGPDLPPPESTFRGDVDIRPLLRFIKARRT